MKKLKKLFPIVTLAALLSGCSTVSSEYWKKPDGFHGDDKEFVTLKFNRQISIGLGENKSEELYLEKYLATKLADSRRFNVLAAGYKSENPNDVVLELTPTVRLVHAFTDTSKTTALFNVLTSIDCKNIDLHSGTYSNVGTFTVQGKAKVPYLSKAPFGSYHQPDLPGLCAASYNDVMKQLIKELNIRFPITGKIDKMAQFGNKTTFQFLRGTIDGVESTDEILIYAKEKNGRITPTIAVAKGEVALNQTSLTVVKWNTGDEEVKGYLMPRIFNGDKTLQLFAVCRKVKK